MDNSFRGHIQWLLGVSGTQEPLMGSLRNRRHRVSAKPNALWNNANLSRWCQANVSRFEWNRLEWKGQLGTSDLEQRLFEKVFCCTANILEMAQYILFPFYWSTIPFSTPVKRKSHRLITTLLVVVGCKQGERSKNVSNNFDPCVSFPVGVGYLYLRPLLRQKP